MALSKKLISKLEENLKELDYGKVVNYFSKSKAELDEIIKYFDSKYHILGPTLMSDENYVITFSYDKKKVSLGGVW
jgi:hypothetical protein